METIIQFLYSDKNNFFIKRDDLIPYSFGGNKARKAIKFYKTIDDGCYDIVVTYGSSSSNHCRVIANMAAARKLPCIIISPKEVSETTFNSRLMSLFGAEIRIVPVKEVSNTINNTLVELEKLGKKPFFIQGGGHGNLGTQSYIDCYEEICTYERRNKTFFDYIFFASGTGTTQAGLICGKLIANDKRIIVGISIARENPRGRQVVIDSVKEYFSEKGMHYSDIQVDDSTIFIDDYISTGYGSRNEIVIETVINMIKLYGIPMDSTYTAKAYYGMTDYLRKKEISGKNVLFIHTGGTPLFFDNLIGI